MPDASIQSEVELIVNATKLEADVKRKLAAAVRRAEQSIEFVPGRGRTAPIAPSAVGPSSRFGQTELERRFAATASLATPAQLTGLQRLQSTLTGVTRTANLAQASLIAMGAVRVGQALTRQIGAAVDAFSSFQEQLTAVTVQFGDEGISVLEDFAETAAQTAGASERAVYQASLTFGAFFDQLGLAPSKVAALSAGLVQLSGDFASFRDVATDEAIRIITAGLAGESEPLRRRGIIVNEAAVLERALALELGKTTKEISQQEKVLVRAQLIFEQLADAQGDFVRTGENLANLERQAAANLENLRKNFGEVATPAVAGATAALNDFLLSLDEVIQRLPGTGEEAGSAISKIGETLSRGLLSGVTLGASETVLALGSAFDATTSAEESAADAANAYALALDTLDDAIRRQIVESDDLLTALTKLALGYEVNMDVIDDFVDANFEFIQTQLNVESAELRLSQAHDRVREAQLDYNDAVKGGSEELEKQTDAAEKLLRAQERILDIQAKIIKLTDDVGESEAKLADARSVFGVQSKEADEAADELRDTNENLRQSNVDLRQATVDVGEADEDYNEAAAEATDSSNDLKDASDRLKEAQLALKDELINSARAQADLEIQQRELNGEVLTSVDRAEVFRRKLDELATTLAPDSNLQKYLREVRGLFDDLFPGDLDISVLKGINEDLGNILTKVNELRDFGNILSGLPTTSTPQTSTAPVGDSGGATGAGGTSSPTTGTTIPQKVSTRSGEQAIVINQAYPTDPLHTAAEIAWATGI